MHYSQAFDVSVSSQGDDRLIHIGLDSGEVLFGRFGDDLVIQSEEGDQAIIENFYDENFDSDSVFLVFEDGVQMQVGEFELAWYEQGEPEPEDGSGIGEYRDGAGGLLAGIDRLGTLGTFGWERESGAEREDYGLLYVSDDAAPTILNPVDPLPPDPPTPPVPPEPPIPPTPGPYPYSARAVLHAQDANGISEAGLADYYVNARAIFDASLLRSWVPGSSLPTVSYLGGDGENLVSMVPGPDGSIKFTLNQAALAWFLDNTDNKYIELYYKVSINDQDYNMQVVIPIHGEFCSEDFAPLTRHADLENSQLVHGEWHAGRCQDDSGTVYAVTSTNMADEMTYDGRVENSVIHTGYGSGDWGADSVVLNCHAAASDGKDSEIVARGADSEILVNGDRAGLGVILASGGGDNTLEASGANSSIIINNVGKEGLGAMAGSGSSVILDASGKGGSIVLNSDTALYAQGSIQAEAGSNITITAGHYGVTGEAGGGSSLTSQSGDILINAGGASAAASLDRAAGVYGGDNILSAVNGSVIVNTRNAGEAIAAGGRDGLSSITAREVNLTAQGQDNAYALRTDALSETSATTIIADKVTLHAETGTNHRGAETIYAAGVSGGVAATNTITTPELQVSAKGQGLSYAVRAEAGGSNILNGGDDTLIKLETAPSWTTSLGEFSGKQTWDFTSKMVSAENGGSNTINGKNLILDGTLQASGPSQAEYDQVDVSGSNTVNTSLRGLSANSGSNNLNLQGDLSVSLNGGGADSYYRYYTVGSATLAHTVIADTSVTGLYAGGSSTARGENIVKAQSLEILADGHAGSSYGAAGLHADAYGRNKVEVTEGAVLDIKSDKGAGYGIHSFGSNSENELTAKYLDVTVKSYGNAIGINAGGWSNSGKNTMNLTGKDAEGMALTIVVNDDTVFGHFKNNNSSAPAQGTAGMNASGGDNTVNNLGGGNILIAAGYEMDSKGDLQRGEHIDIAHGMYASGNTNTINAGGAEVDIQVAGGRFASGMAGTYRNGEAVVNNASKLNIEVDSLYNGGNVHYHFASGTYGVFTTTRGSAFIEDVDEVNINLKNYRGPDMDPGGYSFSRYTAGFGSYDGDKLLVNNNTAKDNTIRLSVEGDSRVVTGQWLSTALANNGATVNRIQVGGENTSLAHYDITGKNAQNLATSDNPYDRHIVSGLYGDFYSQSGGPIDFEENLLQAKRVELNITGEDNFYAAGMWANISSHNKIKAGEVIMDVKAEYADAHGMAAEVTEVTMGGPGFNTITAGKVLIEAESASGAAYGMKAYNHTGGRGTAGGSGNVITSEGALELTITASAGSGLAYAMYAVSPGGGTNPGGFNYNTITGNSGTGTSDRIILNGNLETDTVSRNTINTGSGDDYVRIEGSCKGNGNYINTGDGNDTIVLNWHIGKGSLHINAGDGTDTLILTAPNLTLFNEYYQTWLENLNLADMNVENIRLVGVDPSEVPWLEALAVVAGVNLDVQVGPYRSAALPVEEAQAAAPEAEALAKAEESDLEQPLSLAGDAAELSPQLLDMVAGLDDSVAPLGDGWEQMQVISSYAFNPGISPGANAWLAELDFDDSGAGGGLDLLLPETLQPYLPVGGLVTDYSGQAATPCLNDGEIPFVSGNCPAPELPTELYVGEDIQPEVLLMQQGVL